ncbi:MAG: MotA/TolQ/ExbB proton channel family protein, partial [Chthoniobacterales bacterium]
EEVRKQCLATPGPVARVALSAVLARDCPRAELRDIVQEAAQLEVPRLERHLSLLGGIAYAAPLLGLLGTVLGLLEAFYLVSTQGGYATVADLSGAVYQSLISAAAGLAVAIPALIAAGYLSARVQDLVHDMERAGIEMVNLLKNRTLPAAEILAMDAEPVDEA